MGNLFGDEDDEIDDDVASNFVVEDEEPQPNTAPEVEHISPRSNIEIFGHEEIEQLLLNDYRHGRLPHAVILSGPKGIGKATLAYRLAKFLLAGGEADANNLFTSPSSVTFKQVVSLGHPDLLVVEREYDEKRERFKSEITVDNARRIHPFLQKTSSAEGGWRVVIIDGADNLNASGQNAILKVLEEAPRNTMLILTADQPGAFLPTIRSRCRMLHMHMLDDAVMTKLLNRYISGASKDEIATLAQMFKGSIGNALEFYSNGGMQLKKEIDSVLQKMPELNMVKLHELADKLGRGSENEYEMALDIILKFCEHKAKAFTMTEGKRSNAIHYLSAWENISALIKSIERFNLDKKQGIFTAFMIVQNPEYKAVA